MTKHAKGYYLKSPTGYVCIICGCDYVGSGARHLAKNCCKDKKPLSEMALRAAEDILAASYYVPTPRTKQPGDGELHKDRWGHWRRGTKKHTPAQVRAEYNKAFEKIAADMDKEQTAILDELFYDLDDTIHQWLEKHHKEMTFDKKIAFAFNSRNYNLLKSYIQEEIAAAVKARELYLRNNPGELAPEPPKPISTDECLFNPDTIRDMRKRFLEDG